jgi:hypothetical protein
VENPLMNDSMTFLTTFILTGVTLLALIGAGFLARRTDRIRSQQTHDEKVRPYVHRYFVGWTAILMGSTMLISVSALGVAHMLFGVSPFDGSMEWPASLVVALLYLWLVVGIVLAFATNRDSTIAFVLLVVIGINPIFLLVGLFDLLLFVFFRYIDPYLKNLARIAGGEKRSD